MSVTATADFPLVEEIKTALDAEQTFLRLADKPHCIFLDSALRHPELGRYSFITADPFEFVTVATDQAQPLDSLRKDLAQFVTERVPGLPTFQGGAAGMFSYDLARSFERIPRSRYDEFVVPAIAIGLYDFVVAIDHHQNRTWIISQGFPETSLEARRRRAAERLQQVRGWLNAPLPDLPRTCPSKPLLLSRADLAEQHRVPGDLELYSSFSRSQYLEMVAQGIEYIRAGDIFQVNLSQRLLLPAGDSSVELYLRLRRRNPATFSGYFDLGEFQLASASPERFLQVIDQNIETRPIKGTRKRTRSPEADLFAGDELQQSEKDRAENVMIVDLLRNDLSRVCEPWSVRVTELCRLEVYEFVQHLVSVVQGRLRPDCSALDALEVSFPGGSITGAPKVRAMEIIAELEPTARGAYCGCLGYIGFDGSMDTSILIRTVTAGRGWWQAPVGGGIVVQSDPVREYEETWHKATGLLRAFQH